MEENHSDCGLTPNYKTYGRASKLHRSKALAVNMQAVEYYG